MFTGLVTAVGQLTAMPTRGNYHILTIRSELSNENLELGESIACDGICLTVTKIDKTSFTVEASQETIARSTMAAYSVGQKINLERALRVGDRLGGHFVSGHVDTVGKITKINKVGQSLLFEIEHALKDTCYIIEKGSIAINGISLTVNECRAGKFSVNLIPHSVANTNIDSLKAGDVVNLEYDQFGKYVLNAQSEKNDSLLINRMKESGWEI